MRRNGERLRARAAPPGGIDEMGLYVDDRRLAAERGFGRVEVVDRTVPNRVKRRRAQRRSPATMRPFPVDRVLAEPTT